MKTRHRIVPALLIAIVSLGLGGCPLKGLYQQAEPTKIVLASDSVRMEDGTYLSLDGLSPAERKLVKVNFTVIPAGTQVDQAPGPYTVKPAVTDALEIGNMIPGAGPITGIVGSLLGIGATLLNRKTSKQLKTEEGRSLDATLLAKRQEALAEERNRTNEALVMGLNDFLAEIRQVPELAPLDDRLVSRLRKSQEAQNVTVAISELLKKHPPPPKNRGVSIAADVLAALSKTSA